MNYYYFGAVDSDDSSLWQLPSRIFNYFNSSTSSSPLGLSLKKNHKRIAFALVALYLSYRLVCYLYYLTSSLWRWIKKDPSEEPQREPQSCIVRFLEGVFVSLLGLTAGATIYYAHKQQSSYLIDQVIAGYRQVINQILSATTGYDLTRSSLAPNETLVVGTLLAALIIYICWGMVRFLLHHHIFGAALSLLGAFLYCYHFPITSHTAANYSGTMFIIDRDRAHAHLVPSLIPKLLLTISAGYYLLLLLLKSFSLFLRMSFRFLLYSLVATILLNSITSLISESGSIPITTTETILTPDHHHQY